MNEIIDELERECIYLETKRKKYKNEYPTIAQCYREAKNKIWEAINYALVIKEREGKK